MKYLSTKRSNIIFTIIVAAFCTFIVFNSVLLVNADMTILIMIWLPTLFGLITIGGYHIFYQYSEKYAPFVTILGNIINLYLALGSFWN